MFGPVYALEWTNAIRHRRHFRLRVAYTVVVFVEFLLFVCGWLSLLIAP
jgi:hypothetical protein